MPTLSARLSGSQVKTLVLSDCTDAEHARAVCLVGARPQSKGAVIHYNPDPHIVNDLWRLFRNQLTIEPEVQTWLAALKEERATNLAVSAQSDAPLSVPHAEDLWGYQRVGVARLAQQTRLLLADEMGLGKTVEALLAAQVLGARTILVVTLASAKWQWRQEITRWLDREAVAVESGHESKKAAISARPDILVINYEPLRRAIAQKTKNSSKTIALYPELVKGKLWDVVIFDEAHLLQDPQSQQSKAAAVLSHKAKALFLLTATPIWNEPQSVWHLLHLLDPAVFSSYWSFVNKYCLVEERPWARVIVGMREEKQDELHEIIARYMLRREAKAVLTDLPAETSTVLTYQLSEKQKKVYRSIKEDLYLADEVNPQYCAGVAPSLSLLRRLCNSPSLLNGTGWAQADETKGKALLEFVQNALGSEKKLVILCWHRDYAAHLHLVLTQKGISTQTATGDQESSVRMDGIEQFKKNSTQVLIGTMGAMGTAINLSTPDIRLVLFAEMDWIPPTNDQAKGRFMRFTTKHSVAFYYLLGEGTIEEHIYTTNMQKGTVTSEMLAIGEVVRKIKEGIL